MEHQKYQIRIKFHSIPAVLPIKARVERDGVICFLFDEPPSQEDAQRLLEVCRKLNPTPSVEVFLVEEEN